MPAYTPTPEQAAIIDAARDGHNLIIQAGAGTGKTSTLKMIAAEIRSKSAVYIAYNRAIADEAAASFPATVQCKTAHGLAMSAVGRKYRHRLNGPRQPGKRAAELLGITRWLDLGVQKVNPAQQARIALETVQRFCYSADAEIGVHHVPRQIGTSMDDHLAIQRVVLPYARQAWDDIRSTDGRLRFEHDHYLKLWALTNPELAADVVMLDECQDSNPVVAQLVQSQDHAQQIAVGDSAQQLYAWRGAVDALIEWPADRRLYLSQSWRFGPRVAEEANKWLSLLNTPLRLTGNPQLASEVTQLERPTAILCRTNAAAMGRVMTLLKSGMRVALVGGGGAVKRMAEAARDLQNGRRTSHSELFLFETWADVQDFADESAGRDLKPLVDLIDTHGVDAIVKAAEELSEEKRADVVVSTAHKSKGREWADVQIADDFPEPDRDDDGEWNTVPDADVMLAYVSVTRARLRLDRGGLGWIDRYLS
ncbi:AAA family ATPase [Nocardia sp. CDC159]|uniref:AAA family ATPase n=1 Tax=Nocardia pulmonis TaxID=2951408 RepID=A0A9X2IZC3_9NOCA|nr:MULTISPECIES: AAA family ATPase [Nocardia]MCM6777922.1 AAA family ATPase [Nocardia pulmonis]MCM6790907.1 AAA family ATPase [Nocardia sp. CDC159]